MSEQGGTYLAGPPSSSTRCLICGAYKPTTGDGWYWLKPETGERRIYAGFFCSESCCEGWRQLDDHGRLTALFNHDVVDEHGRKKRITLADGMSLLAQVEAGTYREASEDEPQEVPIFGPRLTTLEASAWVELRGLWGKKINLARSAPHRLEGWREPVTTGSFTRFW